MVRVIGGLVALGLLMPVSAQAQHRGSEYQEWQFETKGPVHGYSGWAGLGNGRRNYYCDYQRIPNRECVTLKSGKERCRVTSWTLKQTCQ
ncbi:MAG TPA: hypothetical protein VG966_03785 [Hyphomicrobiaceae bacterium]|nr:hypothetical protein [Hyphomicrobiaceae bacterium]